MPSDMTKDDWNQIRLLIHEAVTEAIKGETLLIQAAIDAHARGEDHIAWKAFMSREKRQQEIWDRVKGSVFGVVILGSLSWVGYAVWHMIKVVVGAKGHDL